MAAPFPPPDNAKGSSERNPARSAPVNKHRFPQEPAAPIPGCSPSQNVNAPPNGSSQPPPADRAAQHNAAAPPNPRPPSEMGRPSAQNQSLPATAPLPPASAKNP